MAALTKLEIETKRLQSDIDSLKTHLDGLRKTGESMMAGINGLGAMWEGEAKNAFVAQFQSDYETLNSMAEIIEAMIGLLEEAKARYETCESSVASIVSAIRV
ncbi:MAG: WXG100 family type VII secretion target [Hungatella sp.]|nr:WXG100 family type VII secretion target [Hungatella sp.]